jgi:hypothetical protein
MSNREIIDILTGAMRTEAALAIQIRNIASTFPWSGLPADDRRDATESFHAMEEGPARRARRIKVLIDRLQGSVQNVQ